MAFDELQFPLRLLPGSSGGPSFATDIVIIEGGYERRNQRWQQARRVYDARSGVRSAADYAVLACFFQARAGRARGFRVKDWADFTSAADGISTSAWNDQLIGTGNGSQTTFQLVKNYGSGSALQQRQIRKPVAGTVTVGVNGAPLASGWSLDVVTGLVTFTAAPLTGQAVTAGFQFDVPVRFDSDDLPLTAIDNRQSAAAIPLIEVRV
jgi:uncharacterized protein (TIGR02217 family)